MCVQNEVEAEKKLARAAAVGTCHMLQRRMRYEIRLSHCSSSRFTLELSSNYYAKSFVASTLSKLPIKAVFAAREQTMVLRRREATIKNVNLI